jgi:hypothetical protein
MRGASDKSSSFIFQTNAATLHQKERKKSPLVSPSRTTETQVNASDTGEYISRRKKSDPVSPINSQMPSSGREDVTT